MQMASRYGLVTVGLVLLLAAGLKTEYLSTTDLPELDLWSSRWFWTAVVELELVLGIWLLSDWHSSVARICALVCFAAFFEWNLYRRTGRE